MFEKVLSAIPQMKWETPCDPTGEFEGIRALTYEGMPYGGAPTRVFAYYGAPKNARNAPGIVLVHGGGGDAFCCWVKMWVDRGFAALAMDTVGNFPRCVNAGSDEGMREQWTCGPDNVEMRDMDRQVEDQWIYHKAPLRELHNWLW